MQEMQVPSLAWEDSPEKGMATHSSVLAWRIPWTEEPGRLQSTGLQIVGQDWVHTHTHTHTHTHYIYVCVDTLRFRVYLLLPLPRIVFPIVAAQLTSLLHPSVCSTATSSERISLTTPNKTEVPLSLCISLCYLFFKILIITPYIVYVSHLLKCKLHESRGFVPFTAIHRLHWALKKHIHVYSLIPQKISL